MFGIVWYENDRKNMENLLEHKLEKMLIFDRKIFKVANQDSWLKVDLERVLVLESRMRE